MNADRLQVALTAYNNTTDRLNVFNQADVISTFATGRVNHTVLSGAETLL